MHPEALAHTIKQKFTTCGVGGGGGGARTAGGHGADRARTVAHPTPDLPATPSVRPARRAPRPLPVHPGLTRRAAGGAPGTPQASRIIAQMLVAGSTVLFRAAVQAYNQALVNAQKTGVAQEAAKAAGRAGGLTLAEARLILGLEEGASLAEIRKKFDHLFSVNEKHGSFYLQSKIFRAKEAIEKDMLDSDEEDFKKQDAEYQAANPAAGEEEQKPE